MRERRERERDGGWIWRRKKRFRLYIGAGRLLFFFYSSSVLLFSSTVCVWRNLMYSESCPRIIPLVTIAACAQMSVKKTLLAFIVSVETLPLAGWNLIDDSHCAYLVFRNYLPLTNHWNYVIFLALSLPTSHSLRKTRMNDFGMDADSNSWGSDYGEDYGSDFSDGEYQPNAASSSAQQHHQAGSASRVASKTKGGAQARKMVNRGRWTKDEVSFCLLRLLQLLPFLKIQFALESLFYFILLMTSVCSCESRTRSSRESWNAPERCGRP